MALLFQTSFIQLLIRHLEEWERHFLRLFFSLLNSEVLVTGALDGLLQVTDHSLQVNLILQVLCLKNTTNLLLGFCRQLFLQVLPVLELLFLLHQLLKTHLSCLLL